MDNTTRKLMKLLDLGRDEVYHVFCLALCVGILDGQITDKEGEMLTRIGFGLGLSPEDIADLGKNAKEAIDDTSVADVVAFSMTRLQSSLTSEQLQGIKQILKFVALSDRKVDESEQELLDVVDEIWPAD